jgi:Polyketide cyclase / dehydrase and lipid transport
VSRVYVSVVIDAPPADVWSVVEPLECHVDWMADAEAIRYEGLQRRGVGTRIAVDTHVGPLRVTDRMYVTEWIDGAVIGVDHVGRVAGSGRFTLEPAVDGGTLFAWEEELQFPWFFGGRFGTAIGTALVLKPMWRRNLQRLKTLVETRRPAGAG